jgi:hypothetical protein
MQDTLDIKFDKDTKERIIKIIKNSLSGISLNNSEAIMLFHWVRHKDDPVYRFVPKKYRTIGGPNKWATKKI